MQPTDEDGLSGLERAAIALRVAAWHDEARLVDHYRQLLAASGGEETTIGDVPADGRLAALLRHADLLATHPVDARPEHLKALADAGLSVRQVVTTSQLIGYVSFQARILAGLLLLAGALPQQSASQDGPRTRSVVARARFTQDELGWAPWVEPLSADEATPEQEAALPGPRAKSPYFRLLARDAPVLVERTATDEGIFRTEGGLLRGERELAAAVASRVNGCVYCASVHSRFASTYSKRREDVQRLLDEGVEGAQDARWRALIDSRRRSRKRPHG
jgi:uncharacterized peroxidase-related enzyme